MTQAYMVCEEADIDPTTGVCAHPHYVQAPQLIPPLDATAGSALAVAVLGVWAAAAVWRNLFFGNK